MASPAFEDIADTFDFLDDWEDRYTHVIEMGKAMAPLDESFKVPATKVKGCASQVWLTTTVQSNGPRGPILCFRGDSDAHIVRGLIAILFALYSGKSARDILTTDPSTLFERLGLRQHFPADYSLSL